MTFNDLLVTNIAPPTLKATLSIELLQEAEAYTKVSDLMNNYVYTWHDTFIQKIDASFLTGKFDNFSARQSNLFKEYIKMDIITPEDLTVDAAKKLDTYLGSLLPQEGSI